MSADSKVARSAEQLAERKAAGLGRYLAEQSAASLAVNWDLQRAERTVAD
jgi:hypothetical protein